MYSYLMDTRCSYISNSEKWRKPKPQTGKLSQLLNQHRSSYHTMVGKNSDSHSYPCIAEAYHTQQCFCSINKSLVKEAEVNNTWDNRCPANSYPYSWSPGKITVDDNRSMDYRTCDSSPQVTAYLADNLAGITCPTTIKCVPKIVGLCCKMHGYPSACAASTSSNPLQGLPSSTSSSHSYASVLKRPTQPLGEPVKLEMTKSCYSLKALPKSELNGSTGEVKLADFAPKKMQKGKSARFSDLKELVGKIGSSGCGGASSMPHQDTPSNMLPYQNHAETSKLSCHVSGVHFVKAPSPQLSPVKLKEELASPPKSKILGCSNKLIAFIMGSGSASEESSGDDDSDWDDASYDEQTDNSKDLVGKIDSCGCDGASTMHQQNSAPDMLPNQNHAETSKLTCLVSGVHFSKVPSPQLSPVKLKEELASPPKSKILGCSNTLIAFLMGSGSASEESSDDDDSDWDDASYDEQPDSSKELVSKTDSSGYGSASTTPQQDTTSDMSPQLSPVKLKEKLALPPKNTVQVVCANSFIASIIGSGIASKSSDDDDIDWDAVSNDDDGDWDAVTFEEEPENSKSVEVEASFDVVDNVCSKETLLKPKEDVVAVMQKGMAAKDLQDVKADENSFQDELKPASLVEINRKWRLAYALVQTPTSTKVSFADEGSLCVVHEIEWSNPKGHWEELARDHCRFQKRISDTSLVIEPILSSEHRDKVYHTRILPWIMEQHCDNNLCPSDSSYATVG